MTHWKTRSNPYSTADRIRAARRFRQHLWSPRQPQRRIHRVYNCVNWRECGGKDVQTEAHHIDYNRPYAVVWVCTSCHRRIEHGSLRIHRKWIYDYTSLIIHKPKLHRHGEVITRARRTEDEEVPF